MAKKATSPTVVVRCCLPQDLVFDLPGGRRLTFRGAPVSRLVGMDGNYLRGGKYGETRDVPREDWEWVKKTYAGARFFLADPPLLFAEDSAASAEDRAADQAEARHGREQVDVWQGQGETRPEADTPAEARGLEEV